MPIDCIMLLHFSWNARDSICRKCINKNTLRKTFAENLNFRHTPSYAKCFDTSAYQQTAFERPKIYFITENRRRSRFSIEQYEMVLFFGVGCQTRVVAASGHYSYSNKQTSLRMAVLEISRGETRHFYSVIILKKSDMLVREMWPHSEQFYVKRTINALTSYRLIHDRRVNSWTFVSAKW